MSVHCLKITSTHRLSVAWAYLSSVAPFISSYSTSSPKILRDVISPHHFLLPFPPLKCDSSDGCVMDMVPDQGVRLLCCAGERVWKHFGWRRLMGTLLCWREGHCLEYSAFNTSAEHFEGEGVNRRRRHKGRQREISIHPYLLIKCIHSGHQVASI